MNRFRAIRQIILGIAVIVMGITLRHPLNVVQIVAGSILLLLGIASVIIGFQKKP